MFLSLCSYLFILNSSFLPFSLLFYLPLILSNFLFPSSFFINVIPSFLFRIFFLRLLLFFIVSIVRFLFLQFLTFYSASSLFILSVSRFHFLGVVCCGRLLRNSPASSPPIIDFSSYRLPYKEYHSGTKHTLQTRKSVRLPSQHEYFINLTIKSMNIACFCMS